LSRLSEFKFFHGTNLSNARKILRNGLRRPSAGTRRVWPEYSRHDCIYVSGDVEGAMPWAEITSRRYGGDPAVVGIRDLPPECVVHIDPRRWGNDRMICGCDIPPEDLGPVWSKGHPVGVTTGFWGAWPNIEE